MNKTAVTEPTIDALFLRHQRLLASNAKGAATREERRALVADLISAGADTPDGAVRDSLRNMLYFWTAEQSSRDERPLSEALPSLADYKPVEPPPPAPPPPPAQSGGGIMIQKLGTGPAPPQPAAAAASPPNKPVSGDGSSDAEREAKARAALRIAALARQWRLTADPAAKAGYLLTGKALDEAAAYRADDPDIEALVLESEKQRYRAKVVRRSMAIAALVAVILAITALLLRAEQTNKILARSERAANDAAQAAGDAERSSRAARLRLETEADDAVRALAHDDLGLLKIFLRDRGATDSAQLDRLTLSATSLQTLQADTTKAPMKQQRMAPPTIVPTATPLASSTATPLASPTPTPLPSPTATSTPTPPATPTTAASVGACPGFVWLGSVGDSHVVNVASPLDLRAGAEIQLDGRTDYRLRARAPDARYAMAAQLGVVPGGSTIGFTGPPVSVTPPLPGAKAQIWAPVSVAANFCTSVYVQYFGDGQKLAAVNSALNDLSMLVPPAEALTSAKGLAEVRYYIESDAKVAALVAKQLAPFNRGEPLKVTWLPKVQTKPKPRTIEVWLDLSR